MRLEKMKMKPLGEQVIVITGASSGIGLATAQHAARAGAKVVLSSRNEKEVERLAREIREDGGSAIGIAADVRKFESLERLRDEALREFGTIDTWVNNAGTSIFGPTLEIPEEEERALFETNFWGVRHGTRLAVRELARSGGTLINVGSELSNAVVPLQGMYTASKHAVKAYTDAVRAEVEAEDLPVAICLVRPAGIDTPFADHAVDRLEEGEPSLPPPVYHPNVVARAICRAAEHPQRDVYVGAASKMFTVFENLFPRLYDEVVKATMFRAQSAGGTHPHDAAEEALFEAPASQGKIRGNHRGYVSRTSAYTFASQRPWASFASLGALAVVGAVVFAWEKKQGGAKSDRQEEPAPRAAA